MRCVLVLVLVVVVRSCRSPRREALDLKRSSSVMEELEMSNRDLRHTQGILAIVPRSSILWAFHRKLPYFGHCTLAGGSSTREDGLEQLVVEDG